MNGIRERSDKARNLDVEARAYVDRMERDMYEGRMPMDTAQAVYRMKVADLATRYMREECAPWLSVATRLASMTLHRDFDLPPELETRLETIQQSWVDAAEELLGKPTPAP